MNKQTKILFAGASKATRKMLHNLDVQYKGKNGRRFDRALEGRMEQIVPRPSMIEVNGKKIPYEGP